MNYIEKLRESSKKVNNCVCMGLDPQSQRIPKNMSLVDFFDQITTMMVKKSLSPAAFKPNVGYWHALDDGALDLEVVIELLKARFKDIPIIFDSKRGDISRSSLNYAIEGFENFGCDSITVSPYMGIDSVEPFDFKNKGIYVLNRTSNKGGADLQNLELKDGSYLYEYVAKQIIKYNNHFKNASVGAVVGATNLKELDDICKIYQGNDIPLLIPGVGAQNGNAKDVLDILEKNKIEKNIVRINSSSGLISPFKDNVPSNYLEQIEDAIRALLNECKLK